MPVDPDPLGNPRMLEGLASVWAAAVPGARPICCGPDRSGRAAWASIAARADHALPQHHHAGRQAPFPGDLSLEERITAICAGTRWRWWCGPQVSSELGGHIASYASAADLFEVGFNHFFRR